jgi:4-hydroxy-tetrahydrodipicolinate reductase
VITLAINGAAGRMGRRLVALARGDADLRVVAALDAPSRGRLGVDAGDVAGCGRLGVALSDSCDAPFDVMIDFSTPAGAMQALDSCLEHAKPLVCGTTGLTDDHTARWREASRRIALIHAPNMSVGVNIMLRVAHQLGVALATDYDVEIVETHHRFKVDAPSGTAKALLDAVSQARNQVSETPAAVVFGRSGITGSRPVGQIGVHSVRLGDTVGKHDVHFSTLGETLTLSHEAHSRDTFAIGALRAAKWIASRPAGAYSMQDVLFGRG